MFREPNEVVLKAMRESLAFASIAAVVVEGEGLNGPSALQVKLIEGKLRAIVEDLEATWPRPRGTLSSLLDRVLWFDR